MSTRSIIIIGSLIVVAMGAAGYGLAFAVSHVNAGTASSTPIPTATSAPLPTVAAKTKNKKSQKSYSGVIESVNESANSFVLQESGKKAKTITVTVDSQTTISGPYGTISFSSLSVGQDVTVKGTLDSQSQTLAASEVMVTS